MIVALIQRQRRNPVERHPQLPRKGEVVCGGIGLQVVFGPRQYYAIGPVDDGRRELIALGQMMRQYLRFRLVGSQADVFATCSRGMHLSRVECALDLLVGNTQLPRRFAYFGPARFVDGDALGSAPSRRAAFGITGQ